VNRRDSLARLEEAVHGDFGTWGIDSAWRRWLIGRLEARGGPIATHGWHRESEWSVSLVVLMPPTHNSADNIGAVDGLEGALALRRTYVVEVLIEACPAKAKGKSWCGESREGREGREGGEGGCR
jgi:hypothetical protein